MHTPYTETGRQFAEKTRKGDKLMAGLPGLAEISSERMATYLVVHDLEHLAAAPQSAAPVNDVTTVSALSRRLRWRSNAHGIAPVWRAQQADSGNGLGRTGADAAGGLTLAFGATP